MYNIIIPRSNGQLGNEFNLVIKENVGTRNQIYHYSNEGVCSWYDFAVAINEVFGHKCKVEPRHSDGFPSKVKRPIYSVLDKTKIKNRLEVKVLYWKESLENSIDLLLYRKCRR